MSVQFSRGCPFNCEFCDIVNLNGRVPRLKSNEQMLGEFQTLYDMGWRGAVFVVDDNFIGNKVKVKSLLREIIKWHEPLRYPFALYTEASVNLAEDDELMQLMTQAGFDSVFLGLETPAEESLRECGKHQNCKMDLLEAVKKIQRNGMEVMGGFIIGFDNDPPNIFERQVKFIQNSGVCRAMIGLLTALPGTRLYERLRKEGRLLANATGDNCDGSMNFIPKMDIQTLREGVRRWYSNLYSPKQDHQRATEFLKIYQPKRSRRLDGYAGHGIPKVNALHGNSRSWNEQDLLLEVYYKSRPFPSQGVWGRHSQRYIRVSFQAAAGRREIGREDLYRPVCCPGEGPALTESAEGLRKDYETR